MEFKPREVIVPIFGMNDRGGIGRFLGTGSFVKGPYLLTADHVVRDWAGPLAITTIPRMPELFPATITRRSESTDLAVLSVPGYCPSALLELAEDEDIKENYNIVSLEYGTTVTAGKRVTLQPATRLGNVTRIVDLRESLGEAGHRALELSFPALRGASGAPVLSNSGFRLWGVIIANASYHLLPAQIESVLREDGATEEQVRYMLPQGVAVHVWHVRNLLQELVASA